MSEQTQQKPLSIESLRQFMEAHPEIREAPVFIPDIVVYPKTKPGRDGHRVKET